jgi:hypothetical protein
MASRFELCPILLRRWPLASLAAVAPLLGCGPGAVDSGFRITAIAFDGDTTLTLSFSQPVANGNAIDANDFRISVGRTYSSTYSDPESGQTETIAYTVYSDIAWVTDYDYYGGTENFAFASAASSADQLQLVDPDGIIADVCMFVAAYQMYYEQYQYPGVSREIDLFLHYASGDIPLESEDGELLADVGRDWVLHEGATLGREGYGFIHLAPKLRIPCP